MVDALANANRIASSLGSLLLEGAESDICGVLVVSRAFLRSAPVGTLDIALYLKEKLGTLQGWTLSRQKRFSSAWREVNSDLHCRRRCYTGTSSSGFIEVGFPNWGLDRHSRSRKKICQIHRESYNQG